MLLIDNTKHCNIFDQVLFDNLQPYKLIENNNILFIDYVTGNTEYRTSALQSSAAKTVEVRLDLLETLISQSSFWSRLSSLYDVWLPVFINKPNNKVNNKLLARGGSIEKTQLGIEKFISFEPKFKDWTLSSDTAPMTVDWITNNALVPFEPQYSLMFWAKYSSQSSTSSLKSTTFRSLESFPVGSRLRTDDTTWNRQHFIKIDQDKLLIINKDDSLISDTNIRFEIGSNVISSSRLAANSKFLLARPDSEQFIGTNNSIEIWVADGDFYSYLQDEDSTYNTTQSSRSYLSPCLYNKYIQIYHILTLNDIKYIDRGKSIRQSRLLKRLSYALATSPLMDNVCHNYLNKDSIRTIVNIFLNTASYTNILIEQQSLERCLVDIFKELKTLNEPLNKKTINNNYIVNRRDLFLKLTNKYSSYLTIAGSPCAITYNNKLAHGDHVFINQSIDSYCSKTTPSGTVVYNNQSIGLNNINITTLIDATKSEINLNNTKILPLTDIIKEVPSDFLFSIGPDQIVKYPKPPAGSSSVDNVELSFKIEGITGLQDYTRSISYTWEQISGPCLRFEDYYKDSFKQARYTYSTDSNPIVYVYSTGIYIIKCTIVTDVGTVSDTKTIHVLASDFSGTLPTLNPASISRTATGGLKVMCPNFNTVAIHKNGMFWPIKTDLYTGKYNDIYEDQFLRLQGDEKFVFPVNKNNISNSDSTLRLTYIPNNTTIKISRYILQNMRDGSEECSQCKSFYHDMAVSDKISYYRRLRSSDSITLPRYRLANNKPVKVSDISFSYPEISTKYSSPIKPYGGYKALFPDGNINYLNNTKIPYATMDSILPVITGHNLSYKNTVCVQIPEVKYDLTDTATTERSVFVVSKGTFVPNSGFIKAEGATLINISGNETRITNPYVNKSSILRFNPGARQQFTFKGAGFKNLSPFISGEFFAPQTYKSTIQLSIDPAVVPDKCPESPTPRQLKECEEKNQRKELRDHDSNHGYRYLSNGFSNIETDEFGYDNSSMIKINPNCDGTVVSYSFPALGSKIIPSGNYPTKLQNSEVLSFRISDLSVKLNFLNYVNTKNLIVWLDVDVCEREATRINGLEAPPNCQLRNGTDSADPYCNSNYRDSLRFSDNDKLIDYFSDLGQMNYNPNKRTQIRLYLLNQEHLENNTYNFSIEFSDTAPSHNKAHNFFIGSGFVYDQHIINNNEKLLPTTMASGHSDLEHVIYKKPFNDIYSDYTNHKFAKYQLLNLFQGPELPNSSTKFTLNIAVIDEADEMRIYDNINNNDLLTNFKSSKTQIESSYIYNSLCSWELNLSFNKDLPAKSINNDIFSLIDYRNSPKYPGYNFLLSGGLGGGSVISSLEPRRTANRQMGLIPLINHNAPYQFLNNSNLCKFQDFESLEKAFKNNVEFPTAAILQIIAAISTLAVASAGGGAAGAAGALAGGLELAEPGYRLLTNYFSDIRRQQDLEDFNRSFDIADYSNYPFGSPDKILISASKDGGKIWYKMEATTFNLSNLPILEKNKYKYIKLHKDILPELSRFKFELVKSKDDLLDRSFLQKFITTTTTENVGLSGYGPINNITLKDHDIVDVTAQSNPETNGLYTINNGTWYPLPTHLDKNSKLSQYYQAKSSGGLENLFFNIEGLIEEKYVILIQGRLLFDLCLGNDDILCYNDPNNYQTNSISRVGLIVKNNTFYTLLELDNTPFNGTELLSYLSFFNLLLVFKNDNTSKNEDLPLDRWSLEKESLTNKSPDEIISRHSTGSYGDGSPFVDKDILSYNLENNRIPSVTDFNGYIKCDIKYDNNNTTQTYFYDNKGSIAFKRILNDEIFINNEKTQSDIPDEIKQHLYNSIVNTKNTEKTFFYLHLNYLPGDNLGNFGEIVFDNDYKQIKAPLLIDTERDTLNKVKERLAILVSDTNMGVGYTGFGIVANTTTIISNGSIKDIEKHYNSLPEDQSRCYNAKYGDCYKKLSKQSIYNKYYEKNYLLAFLEYIKNNNAVTSDGIIYPAVVATWDDQNNKLLLGFANEAGAYDDNQTYMFNIDPKQECSLDTEMTIKVLKKIVYECSPLVGTIIDPDAINVCPQFIKDFSYNDGDIEFRNKGDTYEYIFKNAEDLKLKWEGEEWVEFIITREFLINAGGPRDTLVKVTEHYDRIKDTSTPLSDGSSINNRVYNIFNLDNTDEIKISPKIIPRKLKGIDNHYDRYLPNKDGKPVRSVNPSAGGPVHNEIRFWHCYNPTTGKEIEPTSYFKLQNEMIYRAYYNSADGIENKSELIESLYPWQWIPYEYDF